MKLTKPIDGYIETHFKSLKIEDNQPDVVMIEGYATKTVVDRDGDLVIPKNIDLTDYKKNPVVLFNHDLKHPVGKVLDISVEPDGLKVKAAIYKDMDEKVFAGVKNGVLKTFSIGFRGLDGYYDEDNDVFVFTKILLFEISVVSVPANQESLFDVVQVCENGQCSLAKKGFKPNENKAIRNTIVSTKPWSQVDKSKLKEFVAEKGEKYIYEAFLVVPDVELKSTWKFPHHEIDGNDLVLNRDGVIAAWAALQGARSRPNISSEQKLKAAKHLLKHYRELVKQKLVSEIPQELLDMVKSLSDEIEKIYSDKEEKGVKAMTKEQVLKLIEENQDVKFGEPIKGGQSDEYLVNTTDKSMLTAYPNPPKGYMVTRYIKDTGGVVQFVIGKSEVAKLLNLMDKVFKDRDEYGNKKSKEIEEKKSLEPIEIFKEIWVEDPDKALKYFSEIEKYLNTQLSKLLNTNKGDE